MIIVQHVAHSSLAGTTQKLPLSRFRLGRKPDCDVRFDPVKDVAVSGTHAEARVDGARLFLKDFGSTNGTFVNGVRVTTEVELRPGDVVRLGQNGPELTLVFEPEVLKTAASAAALPAKAGIGAATLEKAISKAALAERSKTRRLVLAAAALLAVAGGAVIWRQIAKHEDLDLRVGKTADAVKESQRDAKAARELALETRAALETSIESVRKSHDEELAALKGEISEGERVVSSLIVDIESRTEAIAKLEEKADAMSADDAALKRELESRVADLKEKLSEQEAELREKAAPDWPALVERYRRSVFLCLAQTAPDAQGNFGQAIGTAWVCRKDGILATNAHVAEFLADTAKWTVRACVQNDTGVAFEVKNVLLDKRWTKKPNSPDLALVRIDTGGAELVPFPLADDARLRALRIGTQLGTIGYPGELMMEYTSHQESTGALSRAQATFKDGWVGRILDFGGGRADFASSRFIQHSASTSGGTSGSPLFTRDGHVVAVHNSGVELHVKTKSESGAAEGEARTPSASQIAYGIRVDLLRELIRDSGW